MMASINWFKHRKLLKARFDFKCTVAIAAITIGALTASQSAHAFIWIQTGSWSSKGSVPVKSAPKWASGTVNVYYNPSFTALGGSLSAKVTSAQWATGIERAVSAWQATCRSTLKITLAGTTSEITTGSMQNGSLLIVYDNRTTAEGNSAASGLTVATASPYQYPTGTITLCTIKMNGEAITGWGIDHESNKIDMTSVVMHEIGHCLGLDHTGENTYTPSNTILKNALMYYSTSAGSYWDGISQDEFDAMACIYPGITDLTHTSCDSYHGTSGGSALTGTVAGGPAKDYSRSCPNSNDAVVVTKSSTNGSGCITSALASGSAGKSQTQEIYEAFLFSIQWFLFFVIYASFRKIFNKGDRKSKSRMLFVWPLIFFTLGLALGARESFAREITIGAGIQGKQSSVPGPTEPLSKFISLTGGSTSTAFGGTAKDGKWPALSVRLPLHILYSSESGGRGAPGWSYGLVANYMLAQVAQSSSNTVTKTTRLSGYGAGPAARYRFMRMGMFHFFAQASIVFGLNKLKQEIGTAGTDVLEGKGYYVDLSGFLGVSIVAVSSLSVFAGVGGSREKTTGFAITSTSGAFSTLSNNTRLQSDSKDVTIERTGVTAQLGVEFAF